MKFYIDGLHDFLKPVAKGIIIAVLSGSFAGAAWAEGALKAKYEAWELRCETLAGQTSEQCALGQTVKAEEAPSSNLGVLILKQKETKSTVFRIIAPLSVFLPNGVTLKIDQTDIGRAGFFRCFPSGCLADVIGDDKLIEQLKDGKIATLVIYLTPYEGVRHLLMLKGFKEGYEKLP